MALPSSGPISVGLILGEMGRSTSNSANLKDLARDWYLHTGKSKFNITTNISLSLWRGEEWESVIIPPADQLTIQPTLYDGSNEPRIVTINVNSNRSWTVREISGGSATTLSKTSGSGNGSFVVTISVNNSEFRSGEIEVKAGSVKRIFGWSQSGPFIAGPDGGGPFNNDEGGGFL